jgi:hypothetical protein
MSVASSTISLSDDYNEQKLRPPSLEHVSNGNDTFECPFCCSIQIFRNENLWQRHVYADLRSYVCTFADCNSKLFEDQRQWFEHEVEHHRSKWHCSICNIQGITAKVDFRNHIRSHADGVTENQLDALCKAFRQPQKRFLASECPFCTAWNEKLRNSNENHDAPSVTLTQFMKHVGSHMRQLALFALPRESTEEAEDTATHSDRSIDQADDMTDPGTISPTHTDPPAESAQSVLPMIRMSVDRTANPASTLASTPASDATMKRQPISGELLDGIKEKTGPHVTKEALAMAKSEEAPKTTEMRTGPVDASGIRDSKRSITGTIKPLRDLRIDRKGGRSDNKGTAIDVDTTQRSPPFISNDVEVPQHKDLSTTQTNSPTVASVARTPAYDVPLAPETMEAPVSRSSRFKLRSMPRKTSDSPKLPKPFPPAQPANVWICNECGAENVNWAEYCPVCGMQEQPIRDPSSKSSRFSLSGVLQKVFKSPPPIQTTVSEASQTIPPPVSATPKDQPYTDYSASQRSPNKDRSPEEYSSPSSGYDEARTNSHANLSGIGGMVVSNKKGVSTSLEYFWYCCSCGVGPWALSYVDTCLSCDSHIRCDGCSIEEQPVKK